MKKPQALLASALIALGGAGIASAQVTTVPVTPDPLTPGMTAPGTTAPATPAPTTTAPGAAGTTTVGVVETTDLMRIEDMIIAPFGVTADQLDDMDVYGPTGDEIGEVEEILVNSSGLPAALVVEFDTGFLGIGDRDVIVSIDQFAMEQDRLITNITPEMVEALPDWDD